MPNEPTVPIKIRQIDITSEGIRLKYEKFHQARLEEGYFPKRGEFSNNYSDRIDDFLMAISIGILEPCGLDSEVWGNSTLSISQVSFFSTENNKGLTEISISAKISVKNELLNVFQKFSVPRLREDVLIEQSIKPDVEKLLVEIEDFYHGKQKFEQTTLSL